MLTGRFIGQEDNKYSNEYSLMKKRATKHCSWRLCKSDSCYPERVPEGTHFIRFANVGKFKEGMEEWQKNKQGGQRESKKVDAFMWQKRFYNGQD